jgi:hypothetical protein
MRDLAEPDCVTWLQQQKSLLQGHWFWFLRPPVPLDHCQADGHRRPCNVAAVVYAAMILALTAHELKIWSTCCIENVILLETQHG